MIKICFLSWFCREILIDLWLLLVFDVVVCTWSSSDILIIRKVFVWVDCSQCVLCVVSSLSDIPMSRRFDRRLHLMMTSLRSLFVCILHFFCFCPFFFSSHLSTFSVQFYFVTLSKLCLTFLRLSNNEINLSSHSLSPHTFGKVCFDPQMMNLSGHVSPVLCPRVHMPHLECVGGCLPRDPVIGGGPGPGVGTRPAAVVKLAPDVVLIRLEPLNLLPQLGDLRVQGLLLICQLDLGQEKIIWQKYLQKKNFTADDLAE